MVIKKLHYLYDLSNHVLKHLLKFQFSNLSIQHVHVKNIQLL